MRRGVVLFAHGARDPRWAAPFEAVAARTRLADATLEVELAYLEFMTPDLDVAAKRLLDAGCDRIDIVPLFLGAGGHVRRDLPELVDKLREHHPTVRWHLRAPIGEAASVIEAMALATLDCIADPREVVQPEGARSA